MPGASIVAAITCGVVSSPMPTKWRISASDPDSVKHWEKKNWRKPGQSSFQ